MSGCSSWGEIVGPTKKGLMCLAKVHNRGSAVSEARARSPLLRSRVKHSTIKSLLSLTNFVLWVNLQWGFISLYIGLLSSQSLTCADQEPFVRGGPNLTLSFKYILVEIQIPL